MRDQFVQGMPCVLIRITRNELGSFILPRIAKSQNGACFILRLEDNVRALRRQLRSWTSLQRTGFSDSYDIFRFSNVCKDEPKQALWEQTMWNMHHDRLVGTLKSSRTTFAGSVNRLFNDSLSMMVMKTSSIIIMMLRNEGASVRGSYGQSKYVMQISVRNR
jgi:hypothetical protein